MTWYVVFSFSSMFDGFYTKISGKTEEEARAIVAEEFGAEWSERVSSILDEEEFCRSKINGRYTDIRNKYGG